MASPHGQAAPTCRHKGSPPSPVPAGGVWSQPPGHALGPGVRTCWGTGSRDPAGGTAGSARNVTRCSPTGSSCQRGHAGEGCPGHQGFRGAPGDQVYEPQPSRHLPVPPSPGVCPDRWPGHLRACPSAPSGVTGRVVRDRPGLPRARSMLSRLAPALGCVLGASPGWPPPVCSLPCHGLDGVGWGVLLTGCDPELPLSASSFLHREDLGKGPAQEVGGE